VEDEDTEGGDGSKGFVMLTADVNVRLIHCSKGRGQEDFNRLVNEGQVQSTPAAQEEAQLPLSVTSDDHHYGAAAAASSSSSSAAAAVTESQLPPQAELLLTQAAPPLSKFAERLRLSLLFCFASACFVALVFTSMALHDHLASISYRTPKHATFSDCDDMVPKACALPYPSSKWLKPDANTATGFRLSIGKNTLPYTARGVHLQASALNQLDGFSVSAPLLWHLPGVQSSQLLSFQNIGQSMFWNSTTLLLDVDEQKLVAHFTEPDGLDPSDDRILYVQPAHALDFNRRYIVIVQGLTTSSSSSSSSSSSPSELLEPSKLLKQYLAAYTCNCGLSPSLFNDPRYKLYSSTYFPLLVSLGIDLNVVQLMWDFHTVSQTSLLDKLTTISYSTTERVNMEQKEEALWTVKFEQHNDCSAYNPNSPSADMASTIYYQLNVPWYLSNRQREDNPYLLALFNRTRASDIQKIPLGPVGMILNIPCSLFSSASNHLTNTSMPTAILEVGHGLFGNLGDAQAQFLRKEANKNKMILFALDWRGFTNHDLPLIAKLITFDSSVGIIDMVSAVLQGFSSKMAARLIIQKILANDAQRKMLRLPVPASKFPLATEEELPSVFLGISMGTILGSGYVAYSQYKRAVLLVGGAPFTFLLGRSDLFGGFITLLDMQFYSRTDARIAMATWQLPFDAAESSGWSHTGAYNNTALLLQNGLGDSTVTTIGARILANNVHSKLLTPSIFNVHGLENVAAPVVTNVSSSSSSSSSNPANNFAYFPRVFMQGKYPLDAKDLPKTSSRPKPNNVHYCFPQKPQIVSQWSYFLHTGIIKNTCKDQTTGQKSSCVFENHATC